MNRFFCVALVCLTSLLNFIQCSVDANELSKEEIIALTRDHLGRKNPDELLNGFIPVWAIIIYLISATFLGVAILTSVCYLLGCKNPNKKLSN